MNGEGLPREIRFRLLIAGLLALSALILFAANIAAEKMSGGRAAPVAQRIVPDREIETVLDTLFRRYNIEKAWVKSWRVQSPGKMMFRIEKRVLVPPEFMSVAFNHELNRLISQYAARAVALERGEESTVTIHIIRGGKIIESIALVMQRELKPAG